MDWTVHKVAAGYLGVSGCGLFWQGACHLSLSVPYQMTGHRWPPPLWNVPRWQKVGKDHLKNTSFTSVSGGQGGVAELAVPGKLAFQG